MSQISGPEQQRNSIIIQAQDPGAADGYPVITTDGVAFTVQLMVCRRVGLVPAAVQKPLALTASAWAAIGVQTSAFRPRSRDKDPQPVVTAHFSGELPIKSTTSGQRPLEPLPSHAISLTEGHFMSIKKRAQHQIDVGPAAAFTFPVTDRAETIAVNAQLAPATTIGSVFSNRVFAPRTPVEPPTIAVVNLPSLAEQNGFVYSNRISAAGQRRSSNKSLVIYFPKRPLSPQSAL